MTTPDSLARVIKEMREQTAQCSPHMGIYQPRVVEWADRLAALRAQGMEGLHDRFVEILYEEAAATTEGGILRIASRLEDALLSAAPAPAVGVDARRFRGVGELERTGYIPEGSAAEREAAKPSSEVAGGTPVVAVLQFTTLTYRDRKENEPVGNCWWKFKREQLDSEGWEYVCENYDGSETFCRAVIESQS